MLNSAGLYLSIEDEIIRNESRNIYSDMEGKMKQLTDKEKIQSIKSFQSTILKLEKALGQMEEKGANTTLVRKRLGAIKTGLGILEYLFDGKPQACSYEELLEAKTLMEEMLPSIRSQLNTSKAGGPQRTLLDRRVSSLEQAVQAIEMHVHPMGNENDSSIEGNNYAGPVDSDETGVDNFNSHTGKHGISIVKPLPEHLDQAFQVFEETIPDAFEKEGLGHLTQVIEDEVAHKKKMLSHSLEEKDPEIFFLLAMHKDRVIGTISYGPRGKEIRECTGEELQGIGELGSLMVLPGFQGRGVASALIKALVRELHVAGIDGFCLDSGYKRAQKKWLRKFGEPYKIAQDFWGEGSDHMVWSVKTSDFHKE